jgi:hypothetical protein
MNIAWVSVPAAKINPVNKNEFLAGIAARLRKDTERDAINAENTSTGTNRRKRDNSQSVIQIRVCGNGRPVSQYREQLLRDWQQRMTRLTDPQ